MGFRSQEAEDIGHTGACRQVPVRSWVLLCRQAGALDQGRSLDGRDGT